MTTWRPVAREMRCSAGGLGRYRGRSGSMIAVASGEAEATRFLDGDILVATARSCRGR